MFARSPIVAAVTAALCAVALASAAVAGAAPARVDGLDSALTSDAAAGAARAKGAGAGERVNVWVQPAPGGDAAAAARAVGATDVVDAGTVVEAQVERTRLAELAARDDVRFVRPALRLEPTAVGAEGVAPTGAAAWHAGGVTGAGVQVAILDAGFAGLVESQERGELPPTTNLDGCDGDFEATQHGTEVAEIVHAMAPAAELTLICVQTLAQTLVALDEVIARNIPIVNFSAGYVGYGPGDGSATTIGPGGAELPDVLPRRARAGGVLWVNAAGNSANKHWAGTFADVPAGGAPVTRFTIPAGRQGCVRLRWAGWPLTDQDFDLRIVDADGTVVGTPGANEQSAQTPGVPFEIACATNPGPTAATYGARIDRYAATAEPAMELFADTAVSDGTPDHSLIEPSASADALTVGAVCWSGFALEAYSGRGPTLDGRLKPDLVAPAGTSSDLYGPFSACGASGFTGTSASAPHAAGAAALLLQARPQLDAAGLQRELTARALDLGVPGADPAFGAGALQLGTLGPDDQRTPRPQRPASVGGPTAEAPGTPAPAPGPSAPAGPTPAPGAAPRQPAARPTGTTGRASSRTAAPSAAAALAVPPQGRCVRGRALTVRVRDRAVTRLAVARGGRRVRTVTGAALRRPVSLTRLPRTGRYRLTLTATLADGRRVTLARTYRACA